MLNVNQRQLVFMRSKSRLKESIPESMPVFMGVNSGEWPTIRTADTIVIPFSVPRENQLKYYSRFQRDKTIQEWAAFVEVLEIGFEIASAPPVSKSLSAEERYEYDEDEYEGYDTFGQRQIFEYRDSSYVESLLNSTPANDGPTFGRKMLIMLTDENLEDKERERITDKVRKTLGVESKSPSEK